MSMEAALSSHAEGERCPLAPERKRKIVAEILASRRQLEQHSMHREQKEQEDVEQCEQEGQLQQEDDSCPMTPPQRRPPADRCPMTPPRKSRVSLLSDLPCNEKAEPPLMPEQGVHTNPVKKPLGGAFGQFLMENWASWTEETPLEKAKKASDIWRQMPDVEKLPWEIRAKRLLDAAGGILELPGSPRTPPKKARPGKRDELWEPETPPKKPRTYPEGCFYKSHTQSTGILLLNGSRVDELWEEQPSSTPKSQRQAAEVPERLGTHGWQRFTPKIVNPALCMARTWADGMGGQCRSARGECSDFCRSHKGKLVHGRVDGPIPEGKLREFQSYFEKAHS